MLIFPELALSLKLNFTAIKQEELNHKKKGLL
jgi:hypothetical protein